PGLRFIRSSLFFVVTRRLPRSTLFPYTTLFRSKTGDSQFASLWDEIAHEAQRAPQGTWSTWLFQGGRGAGKTRAGAEWLAARAEDRKSTRLNSSHVKISYAVFCLKKKKNHLMKC